MGAWSESLYGNDAAQDTLITMMEAEEQGMTIEEILDLLKTTGWCHREEVKLITADLEYHFVGQTDYIEEILALIESLKEDLSDWEYPKKRLKVLENFEALLRQKPSKILPRSALKDWLTNGRSDDLL